MEDIMKADAIYRNLSLTMRRIGLISLLVERDIDFLAKKEFPFVIYSWTKP